MNSWAPLAWEEFLRIVGERTCAWADYDGFHIGECPTSIPVSTHVWAWSGDGNELIRGRIHAGKVMIATIYKSAETLQQNPFVTGAGNQQNPQPVTEKDVYGREAQMVSWTNTDQRVDSKRTQTLLGRRISMVEILTPVPTLFYWMPTHESA